MTIDKNIKKIEKEKLVEIHERDYVDIMYQALKHYSSKIQIMTEAKRKIIGNMNEVQMYNELGFKVKHFYNTKTKDYSFTYEEKDTPGFKK